MNPDNLENISNFEGWVLTLVADKQNLVSHHFSFSVIHAFFNKQISQKKRHAEIGKKPTKNTRRLRFCFYSHSSSTFSSKSSRKHSKKWESVSVFIRFIIVKMMMKMKIRSYGHYINSPRSGHIINISMMSRYDDDAYVY